MCMCYPWDRTLYCRSYFRYQNRTACVLGGGSKNDFFFVAETGILRSFCSFLPDLFLIFAAALFFYLTGADWAFSVNLILGLFNLLPFSNLDGGAVLRKILEHYELNSSLIMKAVAIISAAIIIAFFYIFNTGNITGYITVILLTVYWIRYWFLFCFIVK